MEDCLTNDQSKARKFNLVAYILAIILFFAAILAVILVMTLNDPRVMSKE